MIVVVMGVAGSGKTTVGRLLASRLGWAFYDADAVHSPENIAKMSQGIPLTDADRLPWLRELHDLLHRLIREGVSAVLACSALKAAYRALLIEDNHDIRFVYLRGPHDLLLSRLRTRRGHFIPPELLEDQLAILEEPTDALVVEITHPPEVIVDEIIAALRLGAS